MCQQAGCASADDLPAAEHSSARRHEFEKELKTVNEQLDDLAAGRPLDEFIAEAEEHLVGSPTVQRLMRATLAVPDEVQRALFSHPGHTQRHTHPQCELLLERPREPLDHGDTAVPSDGSVPGLDVFSLAPRSVGVAVEDAVPVVDDVLRDLAGPVEGPAQEAGKRAS